MYKNRFLRSIIYIFILVLWNHCVRLVIGISNLFSFRGKSRRCFSEGAPLPCLNRRWFAYVRVGGIAHGPKSSVVLPDCNTCSISLRFREVLDTRELLLSGLRIRSAVVGIVDSSKSTVTNIMRSLTATHLWLWRVSSV